MQAPQLQHNQESEEEFGTAGLQQILPVLPEAHGPQGIQVTVASDQWTIGPMGH
jgi:hypothetical protein